MDEEDLADAAEAQTLQTSQAFAGLGSSTQEASQAGGLLGLLRADGDTVGLKLLRKMGWKDGQGIGPKVRRSARLDVGRSTTDDDTYLFAPNNAAMIHFNRKTDRKGLGYRGESNLSALTNGKEANDDDEDLESGLTDTPMRISRNKPSSGKQHGGIGVGVLNDNGSDEEDAYEIGPKIKYNRVLGGDKRKKKAKKASAVVNPSLKSTPIFVPKLARAGNSLRRCHDGRLPIDGFVLSQVIEDLTVVLSQYAPPSIPLGWKSSRDPKSQGVVSSFVSTVDAAKASRYDPRSRAAVLGEKTLPGKSVFDYISTATRDHMAAALGRQDLPPARGEVPEGQVMSEEERQEALWSRIPRLDRETAMEAIVRSSQGPYADDGAKRARYRSYLEHHGDSRQSLPRKPQGMSDDEFLREMNEFHNCARIFKPMTGFMASRFTTAKETSNLAGNRTSTTELISKAEPKATDSAEEAAKMGMFGKMTRSVTDFFPTRLLCKRFNVKAPAHSRPDENAEVNPRTSATGANDDTSHIMTALPIMPALSHPPLPSAEIEGEVDSSIQVNPEKNEAVEGKTANADILQAIFGDSDSE